MKKFIIILLCACSTISFAQNNTGKLEQAASNNCNMRWFSMDSVSTGAICRTDSTGLYQAVGWEINNPRVSLYGNNDSIPLWEYNTPVNSMSMSKNGKIVALGSVNDIYILNKYTGEVISDFNLGVLTSSNCGAIDITPGGNFIVASADAGDSSWVFGFQKNSTTETWKYKIIRHPLAMKISGNDSVVVVNTYNNFYVFETFTGTLRFSGTIAGCENPMGISGNGDVLAVIDYDGWLKVYKWNGTTYILLWKRMEPGTDYFNWMSAVDVSYDGSLIAGGTLNFPTSTTDDGKVMLFKTDSGSTPVWTYPDLKDKVVSVSFSKNGKILSAASWGDIDNTRSDLVIFNTQSNIPIYELNSPGSFFWCETSSDGTTVIASGKSIWAQSFGLGGELYNIAVDTSGNAAINELHGYSGKNIILSVQNYPNPFNSETFIEFQLATKSSVTVDIYNMTGNKIGTLLNKEINTGKYSFEFNTGYLADGVYYCRITANNEIKILKLIKITK